jgi:hypothetical protein
VVLAHQLAMESPMVTAEAVEATEFPVLSNQFQVMGVPDTSINFGQGKIVGAMPEGRMIIEIKNALAKKK